MYMEGQSIGEKSAMKRKQIYLTESIDHHLKQLASKDGRTESEIIREALEEYMTRREVCKDPWEALIGMVKNGRADESSRVDEVVYGASGKVSADDLR